MSACGSDNFSPFARRFALLGQIVGCFLGSLSHEVEIDVVFSGRNVSVFLDEPNADILGGNLTLEADTIIASEGLDGVALR